MGERHVKEIWKDIPGYEGKYQASSLGHIRSVDRQVRQRSRGGNYFTRTLRGNILKPAGTKKNPHLYVVLGHGENGSLVHHLIASAFIGPRPKGFDTRHLNGVVTDNRPENLCYGTRTENILDVVRIGRAWRKLTRTQADEIRRRLSQGETGASLAREFGVADITVSRIKHGLAHAQAL